MQNSLNETQEALRQETVQKQSEEVDKKETHTKYDICIQYNREMPQEMSGNSKQVLGKKILVDFFEHALREIINQSINEAKRKEGIEVIDQAQKEIYKKI